MKRFLAAAVLAPAVVAAPRAAYAQGKDIVETAVPAGSFKTLAIALVTKGLESTTVGETPLPDDGIVEEAST